jgi:hypothetical protein
MYLGKFDKRLQAAGRAGQQDFGIGDGKSHYRSSITHAKTPPEGGV